MRFSKIGTLLPIKFMFMSPIPKKHWIWARARKVFIVLTKSQEPYNWIFYSEKLKIQYLRITSKNNRQEGIEIIFLHFLRCNSQKFPRPCAKLKKSNLNVTFWNWSRKTISHTQIVFFFKSHSTLIVTIVPFRSLAIVLFGHFFTVYVYILGVYLSYCVIATVHIYCISFPILASSCKSSFVLSMQK